MTLLPIVGRELRVASRRKATHRSRLIAAGGMTVLLAITTGLAAQQVSPTTLGTIMFMVFSLSALVAVLVNGALVAADCVALEKREGTLGILFLTDLKGRDVVLGKLVVAWLNSFYGDLLGTLPVMAIPVLMGGVGIAVVARMALVLVSTLFFSISAGLLVSTVSRSAPRAIFWTLLIVLGVAFGAPLTGAFLRTWLAEHRLYVREWFLTAFLFPSPGYACYLALSSTTGPAPRLFYLVLAANQLVSWMFLLLASGVIHRVWQDHPASAFAIRWHERFLTWAQGTAAQRLTYRRRLLAINPLFWLCSRNRLKPAFVWGVMGALAAAWLWGFWQMPDQWFHLGVTAGFALIFHSVLKAWIAEESTFRFGDDARSGAFELLLCTELGVPAILRGQWLALRRQFLRPMLVVLVAETVLLIIGWRRPLDGGWDQADRRNCGQALAAAIAVFALDMHVLGWVGMWAASSGRLTRNAGGLTMVIVMALPWMLLGGWNSVWAHFHKHDLTFGGELAAWVVISLGVDCVAWYFARRRLLKDLRRMIAERYTAGGGFDLRRWLRALPDKAASRNPRATAAKAT